MESEPSRKRKGGQRQRLLKAKEEEHEQVGQSVLFIYLLQVFAWGNFSPQQIQHIASLACDDMKRLQPDGRHFKDLQSLADLGAHSLHLNKMHGEVMSNYGHLSKIAKPFESQLPFKEPHGKKPIIFAATPNVFRPLPQLP